MHTHRLDDNPGELHGESPLQVVAQVTGSLAFRFGMLDAMGVHERS
jgi:hypothetical protein